MGLGSDKAAINLEFDKSGEVTGGGRQVCDLVVQW